MALLASFATVRAQAQQVKVLRGLIPICAKCKKVRDDKGYWSQVETYLRQRTDASFTHGVCPDCLRELYPDLVDDDRP